jgi:hypothetical protein
MGQYTLAVLAAGVLVFESFCAFKFVTAASSYTLSTLFEPKKYRGFFRARSAIVLPW